MKAISIKNLSKTYGNNIQALKKINLEIEKGDFFALLGPNGAGKSTTIGILTSLINKTSGKVEIFGVDIDKDFDLAKTYLGVVPQEFNFNIFETPLEILTYQAGYYGIESSVAKKRSEELLKELGLYEKRNEPSMRLSGGMKRRLMIARALIHEPKILILDEPTAGVDVELRKTMWEFIVKLNKEKNITIILTTHYLEEAEQLGKNVAIINHGEIIENTTVKNLVRKANFQTFVIDTKENLKKAPKFSLGEISLIDETTLEVKISNKVSINDLIKELGKSITITSIRNKINRLEEIFVELTRKK